ncbi:putative GPI-anchored protein pfl2 isoform X2 [Morone saxatilis]|uniref:putative GPI-anchored protein pfl2 isoform X2 n=1 Tax=Morone saxatilis TaxID=34816 RepID=UPI0015E24C51|nr:putative GPI-anchored protein pfl2 isoform X2 [Morone saxatilis]
MANETMQTSCSQEYHEVDECRENIPPGVTAAGKLKVQGGDSSTQPSGEFEPLSDTCTFSTPAPTSSNGGVKTKSRLSGLQSALTPILKYLNIGNKCPSPEPLRDGSSPRLTVPFFPPGNTTTNCQKSTGGSSQPPNSDSSRSHSGRLGDINASVCWLNDEYLPEITLLDVTSDATMQLTRNDSALPDSVPATPVTAGSVKSTFNTLQPSQLSSSLQISSGSTILGEASATTQNDTFNAKSLSKQNGTITVSETSSGDNPSPPAMVCNAKGNHSQLLKHNETTSKDPNAKMVDIPESIDAPLRWLDDRYFPEITLLDVTRDSESSPGVEISSMEVTQDVSSVDGLQSGVPSSELSGQIVAEPGTLDTIESEDLSSTLDGNATHTISSFGEQFAEKSVGENVPKVPLEVTRDISTGSVLEDSQPSTSAEDTLGTHPANVTHDITSSSDMSVQCAASQFSTSDMQCSTNSKNVTSELPDEPVVTTNTVEVNNEELLSSHDAELTSKVPEPSSKPAGSVNGTFTIAEQSNLSTSTNLNTTPQIPCPQNKTLDLAPSNVNSPKVENDARDPACSVSNNATEASPVISGGSCDVQNVTFDKHSLQKSSGSSVLGQAGAATFCLQNNTFDTKSPSKQNGTITVSETSSSDSHQNTSDKPSPAKVCNATSTPKDNNSEVHPLELSKHNETTASTDTHAKMEGTPEGTFEVNPAVEVASGDGRRESKDHSQSGLPMRCGLSDTPGHQSMDTEDDKAYTLNLDDTLDLRADALITSTPMTNCKMFNFYDEQQERKTIGAQKKLYGDGPSKPDGQAPSDVPSNIVCDRKTFLTQTAAKSVLPPLKPASQLLKYKPASILPGRFELLTSGLPMTRQRTQAEALRNSDASQATAGISTSYNLRATTTGSKQPNSGMRKPQLSGIPSGIQRAAAGLRPPSARSHAPASSSTDKLRGPTATHPATKIVQAKKHPLTRGEALPIAKRKKMDAPLPPGGAEASTSSCDAATRAKNLKRPATSQRALPAKTPRDDVAVPASTAETSASCSAVSRVRALKQPVTSNRALPPKPQSHGCAKCVALEQQLEMKSEEIRRLKEELLKYSKPEEEC